MWRILHKKAFPHIRRVPVMQYDLKSFKSCKWKVRYSLTLHSQEANEEIAHKMRQLRRYYFNNVSQQISENTSNLDIPSILYSNILPFPVTFCVIGVDFDCLGALLKESYSFINRDQVSQEGVPEPKMTPGGYYKISLLHSIEKTGFRTNFLIPKLEEQSVRNALHLSDMVILCIKMNTEIVYADMISGWLNQYAKTMTLAIADVNTNDPHQIDNVQHVGLRRQLENLTYVESVWNGTPEFNIICFTLLSLYKQAK